MIFRYKRFYFLSIFVVFVSSFYPLMMGVKVISDCLKNGGVNEADYPKYIIPYTPICIEVILTTLFLPLIIRIFKRSAFIVSTVSAILIFFISEILFEQIVVFHSEVSTKVESWQLYLCMATPETLKTVGSPLANEYSPLFKVHFYLIALLIVLAVVHIIYGFSKMILENKSAAKKTLMVELISIVVFIGLCVLACFTAFGRTGEILVSPVSAILMAIFFIVFGIASGTYFSSIFHGRKRFLSVILPVIFASVTTLIMYIGELFLLGGMLYKFGTGILFQSLGQLPFSIIDICIILLPSVLTYIIISKINK